MRCGCCSGACCGGAAVSAVCCKSVWHGPCRSSQCGKPAKFEFNGNHFCGIHNPKKAKTKAQIDAEENRVIQAKKYKLERAAPDLLEALILITTVRCYGIDITPINDAYDKARAAIAKATGATT